MMVWQLLRAGADLNLADDDGRTPLHAVLHSHEEMAQFHRSQDNDLISRGFQIILEVLLDGGAEKNLADNFGRTPLHVAARQGNLALLHLILKARADPDLGDDDHRTALHAASDLGLD
ncbi:ANK3, partial [Symbiodinium necroappetens]